MAIAVGRVVCLVHGVVCLPQTAAREVHGTKGSVTVQTDGGVVECDDWLGGCDGGEASSRPMVGRCRGRPMVGSCRGRPMTGCHCEFLQEVQSLNGGLGETPIYSQIPPLYNHRWLIENLNQLR